MSAIFSWSVDLSVMQQQNSTSLLQSLGNKKSATDNKTHSKEQGLWKLHTDIFVKVPGVPESTQTQLAAHVLTKWRDKNNLR